MKLVVTGGHLTPAMALLEAAKSKGWDAVMIGRDVASSNYGVLSREKAEVENLGYLFTTIPLIKFNRHEPIKSVLKLPKLSLSVTSARRQLIEFSPDVVAAFGGYVSVPVIMAAKSLGIPVVAHEQTVRLGLANRLMIPLIQKLAVSFESTLSQIPDKKGILVGNLIRRAFFSPVSIPPEWEAALPKKPILYITGGNQGSMILNDLISSLYPEVLANYNLVHQCGDSEKFRQFELLNQIRLHLPPGLRRSLVIRSWFNTNEVAWLFQNAVGIISRSGANTVTEILALKIPAILIPLPYTQGDEQTLNARFLSDKGAAILIPQKDLNARLLTSQIGHLVDHNRKYKKAFAHIDHANNDKSVDRFIGLLNQSHTK